MLASGAHVKIGTYEYLLEESDESHYTHKFEPKKMARQEIPGMPGKANTLPDVMMWSMDDWAGGEGNRVFYPEDPYVYSYSPGLNPRIRGQLTGRPDRAVATRTSDTAEYRGKLVAAQNRVWIAQGRDMVSYSTTGLSGDWTDKTQAEIGLNALHTGYKITAAAGDSLYMYYAAYRSTGSGTRTLRRIQRSGNSESVINETANSAPFAGMCTLGGFLYAWTGARLFQINADRATVPVPTAGIKRVSDALTDPLSSHVFGNDWFADAVATENHVLCFYGSAGQSYLYRYKPVKKSFTQVWRAPFGFTMKSIAYQNGIVYMSGSWGLSGNQAQGALYAMNLDTMKPVFVAWLRKHNAENLNMEEMANSYGGQILLSDANQGKIFVYDTDMNAISMLDDFSNTSLNLTDGLSFTASNHKISDMITWGKYRLVLIHKYGATIGTTLQIVAYKDDEPANRQAGNVTSALANTLYSGRYDFDIPFEAKALHGFHVAWQREDSAAPTTSGLLAGQTIKVEYQSDGGGWTTAGTLTSSTTPSGGTKGRTFIVVPTGANDTSFFSLEIRVTLTGTRTAAVDYKPPILLGLSAEASLSSYTESWELTVRVKDDQSGTRPSGRKWKAMTTRDYLEDLALNKLPITFLDGYRYRGPGEYTTHTVIVEEPTDSIQRNAEGVMRLKLRAVST